MSNLMLPARDHSKAPSTVIPGFSRQASSGFSAYPSRQQTRQAAMPNHADQSDGASTILPSYNQAIELADTEEATRVAQPHKQSSEEKMWLQSVGFLDKQIESTYQARLIHKRGKYVPPLPLLFPSFFHRG